MKPMPSPVEIELEKNLKLHMNKILNNEIFEHRENAKNQRDKKLLEEKEYLKKIQQEIEEEKLKNQLLKLRTNNNRILDYQNYIENKKIHDIKNLDEKQNERNLVTLDLKSDENLKNYKAYIAQLGEKVDRNIQHHKEYLKANNEYASFHYDNFEHSCPRININGQLDNNRVQSGERMNDVQCDVNSREIASTNDSVMINKNTPFHAHSISMIMPSYQPSFIKSNQSDVTNPDYFAKKINNDYNDYRNATRDYLQYNKAQIEGKEKMQMRKIEDLKKKGEAIQNEMTSRMRYEDSLKGYKKRKQDFYKLQLDDQLCKELPLSVYKKTIPNIDPYHIRLEQLGNSTLTHNTILNPIPDYKHNKYLFIGAKNSLTAAGNNLILT